MQELKPPDRCSWRQQMVQMSIAASRLIPWPTCTVSLAAQAPRDEGRFAYSLPQAGELETPTALS